MRFNGFTGIVILWIMAALSALALSALRIAQADQSLSRTWLDETRTVLIGHTAHRWVASHNFDFPAGGLDFPTGRADCSARSDNADSEVLLHCEVTSGRCTKAIETRWEKRNGVWTALYWKENL